MNLIITGAAGWLGSRLIQQLAPRHHIRAVALPEQHIPGMQTCHGDLLDRAFCQRICHGLKDATIIHTAGIIHPRCIGDFYALNLQITNRLLDVAAAAGIRRFIFISSNSVCGFNASADISDWFTETSPDNPYLHYGRSKMLAEHAVREYSDRLETVILRGCWFYGPNQPARQSLFFRMIRQGRAPIVGPGTNLRSMTYVDNFCQAIELAATADMSHPSHSSLSSLSGTYWVADAHPYTMRDILSTVERLLEREFHLPCKHSRLRLPAWASPVAYAADAALQTVGLYHQKLHVLGELGRSIACSIEHTHQALGYHPRIALEEGMRRSIAWCLEHGIEL